MKIFYFLLAIILTSACGNKKAEIVEQIKSYKDSSKLASIEILQLSIDDSKKYEELFRTNGEPDYNKIGNQKIKNQYYQYQANIEDKKWKLKIKQSLYKSKIDSLELELKKY